MTTATATAYLQETVSSLIRVTSVDAAPVQFNSDREHDVSPFYGSDLLNNPATGEFCTAGFAVIGTSGAPRGSTAAHCNKYGTGNQTWENEGYTINGFDPAPSPTPDGTTPTHLRNHVKLATQ